MRFRFVIATLPLTIGLSAPLLAADGGAAGVTQIPFNHRGLTVTDKERTNSAVIAPGRSFLIVIKNTCTEAFDYTIRAVLKENADGARGVRPPVPRRGAPPPLSTKTVGPTTYDAKYGGYIVDALPKANVNVQCAVYKLLNTNTPADPQPASVEEEPQANGSSRYFGGDKKEYQPPELVDLPPATFFVAITPDDWDVSISAGFAFSIPGERKFALSPAAAPATDSVVVEDTENRSQALPGIATFVHMYRPTGIWHTWAPTFGVSIETTEKPSYFGGVGYRFGAHAVGIIGMSVSQRTVLPTGVTVGAHTTNADLLKTLPTEMRTRVMVGLSLSLLGTSTTTLMKPFAGAGSAPGTGQ